MKIVTPGRNAVGLYEIEADLWEAERLLNQLKAYLFPPAPPNPWEKYFSRVLLDNAIRTIDIAKFSNLAKRHPKSKPQTIRFFNCPIKPKPQKRKPRTRKQTRLSLSNSASDSPTT